MLYIHTSNHLEQLQTKYASLVETPLKDVFQTETVIVQNAGMARWLSMQMANTSGISANTEYLFPAEFMWRLLRQISPSIPEHSQCAPDTLRFHIFEELVEHSSDYPELDHYILNVKIDDNKASIDHLSTWDLSCQTARLLDQYLFYRSEWIKEWENANTALSASTHHSDHWQARLWNRCVKDKGLLHWLELQKQFSEDIESFDESQLSERIIFFSMSALSPGYVDVLAGISQKTDIHIFIINPCGDIYWGDIQSPKAYSKLDADEQSYADIGNPLLASLGKQGRDFIEKLLDIQDQDSPENNDYQSTDNITLLGQIQQDIYHLEQPYFIESFDEHDNSIQFHSCHTAMREVEVLHDQILAQLDADKDLSPSDIVVMMPDIEKYAPYIESVFSHAIAHSSDSSKSNKNKKLPFSIADRDPQNIFKIVQALNKLFCLPDSRFDVESVFELLEYDDIRSHFGLSQEELNYCRELALSTNIRWGISDKTRKQNSLPNTEEHTWKYALDRMLLGYALSNKEANTEPSKEPNNENNKGLYNDLLFDSKRSLPLLPYNEIEGSNALILAKFKKFTDTVFAINDWLKKTYSLEKWLSKTTKLLLQLSPENTDQQHILSVLSDIQVKANLAEFQQELLFTVYQKILQQSLAEISASEKYLGYGITFCALVPMRSVPFKVVALMGMNDGEFPRTDTRPSFDLMSKKTRRGDRSRRDEDRYLFLESILAARSKLIISYIGQSIKDNNELPPSILVNELLDTIKLNTAKDAEYWITQHPLQAFSPRYFKSKSNIIDNENDIENKSDRLFSYASNYLKIDKKVKNKLSTPLFITEPLENLGSEYKQLSLNDLISFFKNPSRYFLKTRFGIQTYSNDKELNIREPFALESFKDREIRNLIIDARMTYDEDHSSLTNTKEQIARAKGLLPYGEIGEAIYAKETHLIQTFEEQLPEVTHYNDEHLVLNMGEFELRCSINQLTDIGRCVKQVGKPFFGDYIDLWLTHLFINACDSNIDGLSIKQTRFYSPEKSFQLNSVEDAKGQLNQLLNDYWNGLHYPLAFFPKSSFALFAKNGKKSITDMSTKWNGNDQFTGEKQSFEHHLLHRNLILDSDQQDEEFMNISEAFFGQMFTSMTELDNK